MRIWIVNPYDNLPPEGYRPQRYWLMARAFVQAGCRVTLWTSAFSHASKRLRVLEGVSSVSAGAHVRCFDAEGFTVRLIDAPGYRRNIGFARIFSHQVLAHRWRRAAGCEEAPDLIVCSSPPLSLCASVRKYAAGRGIPYVTDVMDAWPETFERILPRCLLAPLRVLAGWNYRHAAGISAVAERYVKMVRTSYGVTVPVKLFHHGYAPAAGTVPLPAGPVPRAFGDALHLVYCGNMSRSYDLATLIDAVRAQEDLALDLAGTGPDEPALRLRAGDCPRIRFRGYLPAGDLQTLLSRSDVGVIPMFDASCVGIPYKLADYAAAGLPVLNSLAGETAELIARYEAGAGYEAGDARSLAAAVTKLRACDRARLVAGARRLSELFDARRIYPDYVRWALSFR